MPNGIVISGAVEGLVDEAILKRLVEDSGAEPGPVHGKHGKAHLRRHIGGYNNAARFSRWMVLVDLDTDDCAPIVVAEWLPHLAPHMCFRVAVREVEAWLIADRDRLGMFLGVRAASIPGDSERITDPKRAMVELARQSRRRQIREDMVPRPGSGREVGQAYTSRLIEFASNRRAGWRPQVAAQASDSLARCIERLRLLTEEGG